MTYRFLDCHGLAGAFACAAVQAGYMFVGKVQRHPFGLNHMRSNTAILGEEWQDNIQIDEPAQWKPVDTDVVAACVPCLVTARFGIDNKNKEIMRDVVRYGIASHARVVIIETLLSAFYHDAEFFTGLVDSVTEHGYRATHLLLDSRLHGSAQMHKRYYLVLSTAPFGVSLSRPAEFPVLLSAINDLESAPLQWEGTTADGHMPPPHPFTSLALDLLQGDTAVPWMPGDTLSQVVQRFYWKNSTLPASWEHLQEGMVRTNFKMQKIEDCKRWNGGEYAPSFNSSGNKITYHPTQNRLLTYREAARLMGYPDEWRLEPTRYDSDLHQTWARGPSIYTARWVLEWVRNSLDGQPGPTTGTLLSLDSADRKIDFLPLMRRGAGPHRYRRDVYTKAD